MNGYIIMDLNTWVTSFSLLPISATSTCMNIIIMHKSVIVRNETAEPLYGHVLDNTKLYSYLTCIAWDWLNKSGKQV